MRVSLGPVQRQFHPARIVSVVALFVGFVSHQVSGVLMDFCSAWSSFCWTEMMKHQRMII